MKAVYHFDVYIPYTGNYALCDSDDMALTKVWKQVTCGKCKRMKKAYLKGTYR